jgi:hypothetical protein
VFRDSGWTQIRPLLLFGGKIFLGQEFFVEQEFALDDSARAPEPL